MPAKNNKSVSALSKLIRETLLSGQVAVGDLLPSIRELTIVYEYSLKTVHKALHVLVEEGLLIAEPYRGYRVTPLANDPDADCPFVFLLDVSSNSKGSMSPTYISLISQMQAASRSRDWSMLVIEQHGESTEKVLKQIQQVRAFGVILDGGDSEMISSLSDAGIPAVVVNSFHSNSLIDSVMQDGIAGSQLAARYMIEKGHSNIFWFGNKIDGIQSEERLGGFLTEIYKSNIVLNENMIVNAYGDDVPLKAKEILLNKKPMGIVTMWADYGRSIITAANELGLIVGKDFDLISWCMDDVYEQVSDLYFHQMNVPLVTWKVNEMVETALSLLSERRLKPDLPIVKVKIPTQIRQ